MKPSCHRSFRPHQFALAVITLAAGTTLAAPAAWTGTGMDTLWSTPANWSPSGVPTSADDVTVGTTYTSGTSITGFSTNPAAPTQINSLVYNAGTVSVITLSNAGEYFQINTGNITVDAGNTKTSTIGATTLSVNAGGGVGSGLNQWVVNSGSLQIVRQLGVAGGGTGAGSAITKTGAGALSMWRDNQAYAGNWDITGGSLSLNIHSLGSGAVALHDVTTAITGTQTMANNFTTTGICFFNPTAAGNVLTLTGTLTGVNNLILLNFHGGGSTTATTVRLAGSTSFTAGSTIRVGGTVILDTPGNLSTITNIQHLGILKWNVAETVASTFKNRISSTGYTQLVQNVTGTTTLTGQYNLNNGAGTDGSDLRLDTISGSTLALSGKVTDAASTTVRALTKVGAGTAVLSANTNDYRGGTTVSEGSLLVNNTSGSATGTGAVSVSTGATLGGTGAIGGATTIAAGGKLAFSLSTAAGSHDALAIASSLTFSGASALDITSPGGASPGVYTLVTTTGGITGSAPATLNLPAGWAATTSISGNDLILNVTSTGATDYGTWSAGFGLQDPWLGIDPTLNGESTADPDGDGLTNQQEYAFGLNPTLGSSVNSITVPLDKATGQFTYTRRKPSLTTLAYTVKTSTDLATWATDGGAAESVTGTVGDIETVQVTVSAALLTNPKLFVRVSAE